MVESSWTIAVAPYLVIMRQFIAGSITGEEFETVFLPLYKRDPTRWPADIFRVLDGVFADVDDFVFDAGLRNTVGGLDENALREKVERAYILLL